ncbi:GNAT family N-acetyltransferase [Nocardioides sp. DS6]|uniref:GNAT family N-acetyltransferase n=1 Tax=Nocardioides eburneus TaxID=3231482 RepID=A0ABV3SXA8_9ACTN
MPAHLLGPHVVGQRVVVRRLLPGRTGPTGGPAFTDLLGVCLSWGDGVAVIEPASGEPVEVPISLIVSGKPVPPRPSVRGRVSARAAELHTAALVRGVETTVLGDWQLRHEPAPVGRVRSRFNSCLAMGDPGLPAAAALDDVTAFYTARGRTPQVQVEADADVEAAVRSLGWAPVPGKDALFLLASLAQVRRRLPPMAEQPRADIDGVYLSVRTPAAHGEAGLDGDWLGLHGLVVEPEHRRKGLARAVIAALLDAGAEHGATTAWLHVETDNAPAIALYESLGFVEHHRCRYYTAPQAD